MNLFLSFAVSVIVSIAVIPVLMRYAGRMHLLDQPGGRKIHAQAIPRCGGLGLAAGAIPAMLLFSPLQSENTGLFVGGAIILLFGMLDDRYELHFKWKFLGQFIAVAAAIWGGVYFRVLPFAGFEPASSLITIPLTVFFVIGVINAVNMSDGLDGLAAGITLLSLSAMIYLALDADGHLGALIGISVAGGIVGFLWYNTHPAMVFMGDTGSQFIGFMAAFLSLFLTQNINPALNPALPLLLLGLPILDTITVMVRRIRMGRSPFLADKTHIHHRLMEYGFTHAEAVAAIYLLQGVFLTSAFVFRYSSDLIVVGVFLTVSAGILCCFYLASRTGWVLHTKKLKPERRRGHRIWRSRGLFRFCGHYINYSLTVFVVSQLVFLRDRLESIATEAYLIIALCLVIFGLLPKDIQNIWVRFSLYISAIFANVMASSFPEMKFHTGWIMDIFLLILIVMVTIAIRITRKSKFRLTTQDVLVVLFVIGGILLVDIQFIEHMTLRLFCIIYALEYLLHRDTYNYKLTSYFSAISGLIIMALVLPTIFNS